MNHIEYLIQEVNILPTNEFIYLWEAMQEKMKRTFIVQNTPLEKRPFALCKGEFRLSKSFFEPLPEDIIDLFEGKNA